MSENSDLQAWVARAEEDYVLARSALRCKKPLIYGATFHAQQCAEKYLKAALVAQGQAFPKTHDLAELLCFVLPEEATAAVGCLRRSLSEPESGAGTPRLWESNRSGFVFELIRLEHARNEG